MSARCCCRRVCRRRRCHSEERQKPQPPLLLKKVSQYTSNLYRNTPPNLYWSTFGAPYTLRRGNTASTPPICIAVRPPFVLFVLQYASHLYCSTFAKNLGGCGHRDVPQDSLNSTLDSRASLESISTGVWCVLGFGAGCEIALEPSGLQKKKEKILEKGTFIFCAKPWYAPIPGSKEI